MAGFRVRFVGPMMFISASLILLCTIMAVSLFIQQSTIAGILRENVQGQRTVIELEECLRDLIVLEDDQVERVAVLHERVRRLLTEVQDAADE
jgi:two-component system, NtrC family, sensor histidine kinase HydH